MNRRGFLKLLGFVPFLGLAAKLPALQSGLSLEKMKRASAILAANDVPTKDRVLWVRRRPYDFDPMSRDEDLRVEVSQHVEHIFLLREDAVQVRTVGTFYGRRWDQAMWFREMPTEKKKAELWCKMHKTLERWSCRAQARRNGMA